MSVTKSLTNKCEVIKMATYQRPNLTKKAVGNAQSAVDDKYKIKLNILS